MTCLKYNLLCSLFSNVSISEKASLTISVILAFFLYLFLFFQSNGLVEGGQDSYNHFLISKYAFQYPELLLDQWGKPVYTFLAHPFCILGLSAAVWFNISCTILAGILLAKSIGLVNLKYGWIGFWIVCFTPISLGNSISTLTEPLNMLMLSAVYFCWLKNWRYTAVIVFSFMPWIRTEGFVMMVPFIFYLIFSKNYKLIPLLLSATILFNIMGWYQTGKPFWFITDNPYFMVETDQERFSPGPGSFLYYIDGNKNIFGTITLIIAAFGAVLLSWHYVIKKDRKLGFSFWVIMGIFVAYYFAHSFIMWRGMMGTHGMTRVMMVIVPSLAFAFVYFINQFSNKVKLSLNLKLVLIMLCMGLITFSNYKSIGYPTAFWNSTNNAVKPIGNLEQIKKAHRFIAVHQLENRVLFHQLPIYNVLFDKNPYGEPFKADWEVENIWSIDHQNNWAPKGSILIWDAYHAQREGNLKYDKIMNWKSYQLLHKIKEDSIQLNEHDIYIFEKID